MKNLLVSVPSIKEPIRPSPGFAKKKLSDYKLDLTALCGFGCRYCSSNEGNYLRINRSRFGLMTKQQLGRKVFPADDPALMLMWPDVLERLSTQLSRHSKTWGKGKTLVVSMLTDAFSPVLLEKGITQAALNLVLEHSSFRIRVLTKNSVVGTRKWVDFFDKHTDRFVVGLSIGTLDRRWARKVEIGTSSPTARIRALHRLQDAGIPTYGMLCPIFPDLLSGERLEELVNLIRPQVTEDVWAEPYNDRNNWRKVRDGYSPTSQGYEWLTSVFEERKLELWSEYATDLYLRLRAMAEVGGWLDRLQYLLYEQAITASDASSFSDFRGVLLQSARSDDGSSRNPHIAKQQRLALTTLK